LGGEDKKPFSLFDAPPEPKAPPKPKSGENKPKKTGKPASAVDSQRKQIADHAAAAVPAPAKKRRAPAKPGERRPTIAPSDVCTRCSLPKPTERRFVVVHHSPEEETHIGVLSEDTYVYHQVDYYCMALCADCRKRSDIYYNVSRVFTVLRAVGGIALAIACVGLYLQFGFFWEKTLLMFLFGGGLMAVSVIVKWFIDNRHVNYLPLDFNYGRKIVFHATDVAAFTGYLQKKHNVHPDALREIRETFG